MYLKVGNYEIVFNVDKQTLFTEIDSLESPSITFTQFIIYTLKKINNLKNQYIDIVHFR